MFHTDSFFTRLWEALIVVSTVWSKADLHVHSSYSDGADSIPDILEHTTRHTDLKVIAITDHDCIQGALEAQYLAPRYGVHVVVGQEVTTNRGHLLALFIRERITPGLSIGETVEWVHAQGGVAILAHPLDRICDSPMRHRPWPRHEDWVAFGLDGVEGLNGCQIDPAANHRALQMGKVLGCALTGGSDAHHRQVIGVAHTLFPGSSPADLKRALIEATSLPSGRRWRRSEYFGWAARSLIPRTVGASFRVCAQPVRGAVRRLGALAGVL
ncbi:MAG: CehA/McbA family metallohydrolase [Anaerolineae bacterium]